MASKNGYLNTSFYIYKYPNSSISKHDTTTRISFKFQFFEKEKESFSHKLYQQLGFNTEIKSKLRCFVAPLSRNR